MDWRKGGHQAGIPLVADDHQCSRFGDGQVCPGNADIRLEKELPHFSPCLLDDFLRLRRYGLPEMAAEKVSDLFFSLVKGGGRDVGRLFFGQLDDPFPEVSLDDPVTFLLELRVEHDFLADH